MVISSFDTLSDIIEPLPLYQTKAVPNDDQYGQMQYMNLIEANKARSA